MHSSCIISFIIIIHEKLKFLLNNVKNKVNNNEILGKAFELKMMWYIDVILWTCLLQVCVYGILFNSNLFLNNL